MVGRWGQTPGTNSGTVGSDPLGVPRGACQAAKRPGCGGSQEQAAGGAACPSRAGEPVRPVRSTPSSVRPALPAPLPHRSRILHRQSISPPRRVRSTHPCRSARVLRNTHWARPVAGSSMREGLIRLDSWSACEWRLPCRSPVTGRRSHSPPLDYRRRSEPDSDAHDWLTTPRAVSHAAAGGRRGYVGRAAARGGLAHVEVRHAAPAVDVDLAASQEHRLELPAGALHT